MNFPIVALEDTNSGCSSLMATIPLHAYLELVEVAYKGQGGLAGQRAPIRTKTGLKIRGRLVEDLKKGAVIPPIVIGGVPSSRHLSRLKKIGNSEELVECLTKQNVDLSIIDGMQRTTALLEAKNSAQIEPYVRVEFWFAKKVESLIYRMLVLNTGQVPWDLKRQLDTLYRPIISRVKKEVSEIRVIGLDENNRRSQAGEYRSTRVIELFLAFTSRSIDVDIKERIAEEFVRIDITEATSNESFFPLFIESLNLLSSLDKEFSRVGKGNILVEEPKIKSGKDIFTSAPSSIGFMAAVAEDIFGPPGFDYDLKQAKKQLDKIKKNANTLLVHMKSLNETQLASFIDLDTLNQLLSVKSGKVGDYERNMYKRAFSMLLEKTKQLLQHGSLSPCWQAR
ncbi:MAG TPA: hypothetical protein PLU47_15745 [Azonexus sp.]|nr:hypothetical protein [Azonexus sp.]